MNDFILHGGTLSSKASLYVLHENTSRYLKILKTKKRSKNQLFTRIHGNKIYELPRELKSDLLQTLSGGMFHCFAA